MQEEILNKLNSAETDKDLFEVIKMINEYATKTDDTESIKLLRRKLATKSQKLVRSKPLTHHMNY